MRVISELIHYLMTRGSLTAEQIQWLADKRYLELPDDWDPLPDTGHELDPADTDDTLEEHIPRHRAGRSRSRRSRSPFTARKLARLIEDAIPSWRDHLDGLLTLARRWESVDYQQMPLAIRNAEEHTLREAVAATFASGGAPLCALWHAATFDGWMQVLPKDAGGPAVNAFRVAVAHPQRTTVGTHAWVLREPTVRWIYQLT
jgi:hypothetical protein